MIDGAETVELTPEQAVAMPLLLVIAFTCVGLIVAQSMSAIARLAVGPVVAADRRATRRWRIALTILIAAVGAVAVSAGGVWPVPVVLALGSALLLVHVTPSSSHAVLGEGGVQRGWHARRFESLEEWRLTGDHLRFRLYGEWTSVPCPPHHQAALRAKLTALAPDRESPFQD